MEKSKMNRFQYNERIYNYKHGLVNSAENQTIEHSSENEEHIEHALPGTPGSYNYNSGRAKGWEWDDHKYIRKEERADGTIKYIYADGSSRVDDTNKINGQPMRTAAMGGTPGGSYTPPMNKTPNNKPVDANAVNNSSYIPTQTNLGNGFKGTPGGSTYRKPVAGTPTGPLGNGVTSSQPRDTFKANLHMGQGGTPTGLTGTYKNIDPTKVDQANAVLTAQGYKKEADKSAAEKNLYNGQGGTPTGLTGTAKPMSEQAYNLASGKGTPGGVNGPATPKNAYAADIWSSLKNAVTENGTIQPSAPVAEEPQVNPAAGREAAEKSGQSTIADEQKFRTNYISFANAMNGISDLAKDYDTIENDEEFIARYVAPIEEKYGIPSGFTEYLSGIHDIDEMLDIIKYDPGVAKDFMALSNPAVLRDIRDLVDADVQYSIDNNVNLVRRRREATDGTTVGEFASAAGGNNGPVNLLNIAKDLNGNEVNSAYANYAMGYAMGYLLNADDSLVSKYPEYFEKDATTGINHVQIDPSTGARDIQDVYYDLYSRDENFREFARNMYLSTIETPAAKTAIENINKRKQNG